MKPENYRKGLEDRFKGSILGAAIGDALGMPTEYISRNRLNMLYNDRVTNFEAPTPDHPCRHLKAGQYTDDTQQVIILAESLIKNNGFDFRDFAKAFGEWGHRNRIDRDYWRFPGGTSLGAAERIYNGEDPNRTGLPHETCGAAMRIAPIGLFYHSNREKLKSAAKDAARLSHNHESTIDSAVLISAIIANILNGNDALQSVKDARKFISSHLGERIDYVTSHIGQRPEEVMKTIGVSESVYETVPMAVSCFLHSPSDFEKTVINAANLVPGDTDSIACIAGAISGAYNGYDKIPKRFIEGIEDREKLESIATRLLEKSVNHRG